MSDRNDTSTHAILFEAFDMDSRIIAALFAVLSGIGMPDELIIGLVDEMDGRRLERFEQAFPGFVEFADKRLEAAIAEAADPEAVAKQLFDTAGGYPSDVLRAYQVSAEQFRPGNVNEA